MTASILCMLLPALPGCTSLVDYVPTPRVLVSNRAFYNGKTLYVTGSLRRRSAEYFICAEGSCVRVIAQPPVHLHAGDSVSVRGPYSRRADAIRATEVVRRS